MASSYGALVSLVHVLNRVQHPACPASFEKLQIQSLLDKVNFLVDFLEAYSQRMTDDLARKMVVAAFAAEDKIESYIRDRTLKRFSFFAKYTLSRDLEKAIQEMDFIIQEAMEVKDNNGEEDKLTSVRVGSSETPVVETVKMVGFDDEFTHLMGQLTARQSSRQIIPIVGMGGIGKTTLARHVYDHPQLKYHFDIKAWVTISQEFTVGKIIRPLLRDIGVGDQVDDTELGDQLHKSLYGRKYLVILDDIWDTKAWDEISRFCPDNNNGSRILLTTRISDVARSVGSCSPLDIQLLDGDKSWDLLCRKVFEKEACPPELEECGKKISKSCKGLPLAIVVIGGLLKTSKKTRDHWDDVAGNISSIISRGDGEHCLKILSLSYQHLPIHLKPCLLYFATYPYDHEIRVSQLIKLWAADGFLKPSVGDTTLEEVALKYLNDLVNRNLITVNKLTSRGRIKVLTVHDLVMDLCMIEVEKEKFLYVDYGAEEFLETIENERRIVFRGSECKSMQPKGFPRSFISLTWRDYGRYISQLSLLRVFCVTGEYETHELMQLVNLRLLQFSVGNHRLGLFSKISLLWNLETLIVDHHIPDLHPGIWNLRHVKHLIFRDIVIFPDPPPNLDADSALQNLQRLEIVLNISDKVLDMIPNIKRLGIRNDRNKDAELSHGYGKLAHCHKLETLKLAATKCIDLKNIKFPNSLKKLILFYCMIPRGKCGVGSLPNLQVLKISASDFEDDEWNTVEGEFQSLKILTIAGCSLKTWTTEDCSHFPSLEHLSLERLSFVEEIPDVFGESTTLESIKLYHCTRSAYTSAKQILDKQQSQGNYDLTVNVVQYLCYVSYDKEELRADLEGMANDNFHVTVQD